MSYPQYPYNPTNSGQPKGSPCQPPQQGNATAYNPGQNPGQFPGQPRLLPPSPPWGPSRAGQFPGQFPGQFQGRFPGQPGPYPGQPSGYFGYAGWGKRVLAAIIDYAFPVIVVSALLIFYLVGMSWAKTGLAKALFVMLYILPLLFIVGIPLLIYGLTNFVFKQGNTGQTMGKAKTNIKLIKEKTGQPIGAGGAFVRYLLHLIDVVTYVGFLAPLWTKKKQTFTDLIMGTIVVNTKPQPQKNPKPRQQNTNYYQGR